jgi:hypothetical protein
MDRTDWEAETSQLTKANKKWPLVWECTTESRESANPSWDDEVSDAPTCACIHLCTRYSICSHAYTLTNLHTLTYYVYTKCSLVDGTFGSLARCSSRMQHEG